MNLSPFGTSLFCGETIAPEKLTRLQFLFIFNYYVKLQYIFLKKKQNGTELDQPEWTSRYDECTGTGAEFGQSLICVERLTLDFGDFSYISPVGLHVLLSAQK